MNTIFVIIVTYNGVLWIEKCINSIAISTVPVNVIVIDNCSSDETVFLIKENYPWVKLVENKENLGFGKANNIGIKYAIDRKADFVLLLNQDAWLEPDTIDKLLDASLKNKNYWIFSPLQIYSPTGELDFLFHKYLRETGINGLAQINKNEIIEIPYVNAAVWFLPINAIKEIGGFDPIFSHYGEDNDYIRRVRFKNYKVGVVFGAIAYHDRDQNINRTIEQSQNRALVATIGALKDINCSLFSNIVAETYRLFRNVLKSIMKFSSVNAKIEIMAYYRALASLRKIIKHRQLSRMPKAFI